VNATTDAAAPTRTRPWALAARSLANPSGSAATRSSTRQAVGAEATGPNSSGWSRRAARSLKQSPPSASTTARSRSTAASGWRRAAAARQPSALVSPTRSASSRSNAAPACPTTPVPSVVTSKLDGELVACTPKVPSLTTDTTFAQPYPPWSGGHFHNQAPALSHLMKSRG
jgi:hypothetical protein